MEKKLVKPDNAPIIKNIMGDRTRERQQHEQKGSKFKEQLEEIEESLKTSVVKGKEKMEAEVLRHTTRMAELESFFVQQREVLKSKNAELEEQIRRKKPVASRHLQRSTAS